MNKRLITILAVILVIVALLVIWKSLAGDRVIASNVFAYGVSPDGKQVAFLDNNGLYVVPVTGGAPRLLMATAQPRIDKRIRGDWDVQWSPDSTKIAFLNDYSSTLSKLILLNLTNGSTQDVDSAVFITSVAWSPDGSSLAWIRETGDKVSVSLNPKYPPTPQPVRRLVVSDDLGSAAPPRTIFQAPSLHNLKWTADGNYLIFVGKFGQAMGMASQLSAGVTWIPLVENDQSVNPSRISDLDVSPDGKSFSYISDHNFYVNSIPPDETPNKEYLQFLLTELTWTSDGQRLLFIGEGPTAIPSISIGMGKSAVYNIGWISKDGRHNKVLRKSKEPVKFLQCAGQDRFMYITGDKLRMAKY
ncbi:MAG: hypothetical protein ACYC27_05245 [Armatimonadota bacterium]